MPAGREWLVGHASVYLRAGEVLRGAFPVRFDPLVPERVPKAYRRPVPQAAGDSGRSKGCSAWLLWPVKAVAAAISLPAGLLEEGGSRTWRGIRRAFRGPVWQGGWESAAGRFVIAGRTGGVEGTGYDNDALVLVFTDQRLLLLNEPGSPERVAAQLLGEWWRGQFAERREGHPARHRYRVDVAFPDGSWVALSADERDHVPRISGLLRG
ncbi:hypothetical protein [Streptomyces sp. MST-110588]|uniref:hypothetical protein n=1 Tax=Streptomyces sp. MST-110588 TaxID=2833628 RepID=UPI001F5D114F|nr:hypothetical protein [Streptomyces sp. MST-110588]UNO39647.1 hypothetical protein KGS77_08590 [Streptomyces sp. MST-110588]